MTSALLTQKKGLLIIPGYIQLALFDSILLLILYCGFQLSTAAEVGVS